MASNDSRVTIDPELVHAQSAALVGHAASLQTRNQAYVNGLAGASPGWIGSSARALDALMSHGTQRGARLQNRLHRNASGMCDAADGLSDQDERNRRDLGAVANRPGGKPGTVQAVDFRHDIPKTPQPGPAPGAPGVPSDPHYPFVDRPWAGQWETVPPPPPYVGKPPPLQPEFRPVPRATR